MNKHITLSKILSAFASLLLAGAALAGPLDPPAGPVAPTHKTLTQIEPRIPVSAATTPGDADSVYKITSRGSYYLTGSISGVPGKHGIEINASNVTLDLGGFVLGSGVAGTLDGINVARGYGNITICNGTITLWIGEGVDADEAKGMRVFNVTVVDNAATGLSLGQSARVEHCVVQSNGAGIFAGAGSVVTQCSVFDNDSAGISASAGSTISHCVATSNGIVGIIASYGSMISDCVSSGNSGAGFSAFIECKVRDCSARDNEGDGFLGQDRSVFSACTSSSNGLNGFKLNNNCKATECSAHQNSENGFHAVGRADISGCLATGHPTKAGFILTSTGTIRNSTASANLHGIRSDSGRGLLILDNEITDNAGAGIFLNGAASCRVEGNSCYSNGGTGIAFSAASNNLANLAIRNTGRDNGGIDFSFGSGNHFGLHINNPGPGFVSPTSSANISY